MEKSVAKFTLLALPLFALTACQDYEPFSEAEVHATMAAREFAHNFEARYGKVDPNHTWGFGPITGDVSEMTRGNGEANPEKNLWESKYHLEIPGWPDVYIKNGSETNGGYHYAGNGDNLEIGWSASKPDPNSTIPAGDVTDEEIQYVSWYFRTHRVGKEPIHLSDYFIQEISSDNDRDEYGNVITKMPIYENGEHKDDENVDTWGLEYLHAKNFENNTNTGSMLTGYTHINNFNHGASNNLSSQSYAYVGDDPSRSFTNNGQSKIDTHHRMIQYYSTAGTEDFMVKCSQETANDQNNTWHNDWALVHLVFDGPSGRHYDGYYLGFDYSCEKTDAMNANKVTRYERDGYYSNWIFKISAAEPMVNNPYSRRIMCEDLGNTFDFDFNDVVFDATYNLTSEELRNYTDGSEVDVTITVRASGGTLPIYIGSSATDKYEAHYLLGKETSSHSPKTNIPVNVGPKGESGPIATYHVTQHSLDADDIDIYVKSRDGQLYHIDPVKKGNLDYYNNGEKGNNVVPQKFAVPIGVRWMQECEFIEDGYEYFENWVNDRNFLNNGKAWYDNANIKNLSLLYANGEAGVENTNSTQTGEIGNQSGYPEYGQKVNGTFVANAYFYFPVNTFSTNKKYELTVIVESNNNGDYPGGANLYSANAIDHTAISYDSNYISSREKVEIDVENKIYGAKCVVDFTSKTLPTTSSYFVMTEIMSSAKSFIEVRVKEVAN